MGDLYRNAMSRDYEKDLFREFRAGNQKAIVMANWLAKLHNSQTLLSHCANRLYEEIALLKTKQTGN